MFSDKEVIAAVGFMDRRLEILKDVDPLWTSLIESCCFTSLQPRHAHLDFFYFDSLHNTLRRRDSFPAPSSFIRTSTEQ
ncbi:hypothetical protein L1987_39455 [Smallanthus sonchifolius]|uniref:Uncharacterized protein n=1 Tax=Smallanthus sonchifolius TaxID=185202 RepID=A0ACB9HM23_9ASTR|nr:hypothetical protein L1987_39455 [Smallanthus sonchifolius]